LPEDEDFVSEEEAEAAEEAAAIGGRREPDTDESEGFELAERDLEDIAEHGDEHRFPDGMSQSEEPQDLDEYGEPDEAIPPDENE
jgi:hypothetical protein